MSKTVTVGEGPYKGDTNEAIQKAVDDVAAAGGGVVNVPAGTYRMHDSLHLRSNVRVVGRKGAVLKKIPSVSSPIADFLGYGHYEFTVKDPSKFRVGMGVHLLDDNAGGFYTTGARITGQKGELFYIDQMLNHDYLPGAKGRVVSAFSLVEGTGVHDAGVEGLVLDGSYPEETFRLNGCRGGGVFLLRAQRVDIRDVEVRNFNGDAVSFQQCVDVVVADCRLHHNTGHGLHPGSGSVRYVMRGVAAHDNGGCGVYYCLRTTHSTLENCELRDNGQVGISIGERDTDHLIRGNRIRGNAGAAIDFRRVQRRGGERVILRANAIGPNCAKGGEAEVTIAPGVKDVYLDGNTFTPAKDKALRVEAGCANIGFFGNTVGGAAQQPQHVAAGDNNVGFETIEKLPPVGPAALPADGARHLNLPDLAAWPEGR